MTSTVGESGGNGDCGYNTLAWFMQVPGNTTVDDTNTVTPGRMVPTASNTPSATPAPDPCYKGLMWDPAPHGALPGFMDRSVIYGINIAQGDTAMNVVAYVGSVRVKVADGEYDYKFTFN
jgi:hypothetical protein